MPAAMSEPIYEKGDLGPHLARARETAGLTKAELSRRLGISRQHVTNVETGANPPSSDLLLRWLAECGAPFRLAILDAWGQVAAQVHSAATPPGAPVDEMQEWAELLRGYWRLSDTERARLRAGLKGWAGPAGEPAAH